VAVACLVQGCCPWYLLTGSERRTVNVSKHQKYKKADRLGAWLVESVRIYSSFLLHRFNDLMTSHVNKYGG